MDSTQDQCKQVVSCCVSWYASVQCASSSAGAASAGRPGPASRRAASASLHCHSVSHQAGQAKPWDREARRSGSERNSRRRSSRPRGLACDGTEACRPRAPRAGLAPAENPLHGCGRQAGGVPALRADRHARHARLLVRRKPSRPPPWRPGAGRAAVRQRRVPADATGCRRPPLDSPSWRRIAESSEPRPAPPAWAEATAAAQAAPAATIGPDHVGADEPALRRGDPRLGVPLHWGDGRARKRFKLNGSSEQCHEPTGILPAGRDKAGDSPVEPAARWHPLDYLEPGRPAGRGSHALPEEGFAWLCPVQLAPAVAHSTVDTVSVARGGVGAPRWAKELFSVHVTAPGDNLLGDGPPSLA